MEQSITTIIEGVSVVGQLIHHSRRYIIVRITSPYQGLQTSLYIPLLAAQSRDFQSDYGVERATDLLAKLYFILRDVEENKETLKHRYHSCQEMKKSNTSKIDQLEIKKKAIKKSFKAGEITEREMFFRASAAGREQKSLRHEIIDAFQTHVLSCMAYSKNNVIPIDIEEQLMSHMEKWFIDIG